MDSRVNEKHASVVDTRDLEELLYIAIDSLNLEYIYTVSIIYKCACVCVYIC